MTQRIEMDKKEFYVAQHWGEYRVYDSERTARQAVRNTLRQVDQHQATRPDWKPYFEIDQTVYRVHLAWENLGVAPLV